MNMRSIVLMYVTHLAQVMISTLPSSQHFTSYTVCVLTHCAPLGSNYFFETENICTTKRHLESGASIKKARNLLYNSLHFCLDSWRSSKKKKKRQALGLQCQSPLSDFFIAKLNSNFNFNLIWSWVEFSITLHSSDHPPTQPPNHPPDHPWK